MGSHSRPIVRVATVQDPRDFGKKGTPRYERGLGWGPRDRPLVLLTQNLAVGGAQRQLVTLANSLVRRGRKVIVLVSYANAALAGLLGDANVDMTILGKAGRLDVVGYLVRLFRVLKRVDPAIIYSFLDASNLIALIAQRANNATKVVWGVRASDMDLTHYGYLTRLTFKLAAGASQKPALIIYNSFAGQAFHTSCGYRPQREEVIPNGIDTERFRFSAEGRSAVRHSLGIGETEVVIGLAARVDPMKDYFTYLEAAATFLKDGGRAQFVCIGSGAPEVVRAVREYASTLNLGGRVSWIGERLDMPAVYSGLDLHTSTSAFGEGFSNSIAESMACGLANVVTDVGDSARIVGTTGVVVPPKRALALAAGWNRMLSVPRDVRATATRSRIISLFSVDRMAAATESALDSLFLR